MKLYEWENRSKDTETNDVASLSHTAIHVGYEIYSILKELDKNKKDEKLSRT